MTFSIYTFFSEFKPFGFGPSSYVIFKQKQSYQRDALLTSMRGRRATDTSSIFIRFRTTNPDGLLFYAERGSRTAVLYVSSITVIFLSLILHIYSETCLNLSTLEPTFVFRIDRCSVDTG